MCAHRDVLALLGNAAIWFHYSPLHYPLHLSILLLAQHTLNFCLFNCICTVQIVLVWALVSNFIIQPADFQPTFVHTTLLRLHSLCICTCVCVCLDKIYHHASKCRQKRLEKLSIFVSEKEMVQYISFHLQRLSTFMSCSHPVFTYTQSLYFCICDL